MNSKLPRALYDQVAAIAEAEDSSVTRVCTDILIEALAARMRLRRPRVRAAVVVAALEAGRDVSTFVEELIELGLEAHFQEQDGE